jgi:hypothetical protein
MAKIKTLIKRLDALDKDRGYFTIMEIVSAIRRPETGECPLEALQREHPLKTFNPEMIESILQNRSPEDRSE